MLQIQRPLGSVLVVLLASFLVTILSTRTLRSHSSSELFSDALSPDHASTLERCRSLNLPAGPAPTFHNRSESDRFVAGTLPTWIRNATIWTGGHNGSEIIVNGDILLDKGMILEIGNVSSSQIQAYGESLAVLDAQRRWVTPGIVDLHSHMGDASSPAMKGADDGNSFKGISQPWLRAIDAINTHDESYRLSIAGGLTTALILPGSGDAIGGQGYVIKLRKTAERSTSSMILEPPFQINSSLPSDASLPPRWRHIKHACGENPSRSFDGTRMDTFWAFRQSYDEARQLKKKQDDYCAKAEAGQFDEIGEFPTDLKWEALVDVLRGRVKVNTHCYEAVDLDAFVRLSNEFEFPVAAFHHATEAYLVPKVLRRAYGGAPASAIFSGFGRYKRESYRFSELAAKILNDNGLTVVMKSDHPAINSRYLLYEAQQAFYHGLPDNVAIASVTSNPAEVMGMGHRIGYVKKGWDADLVLWDSHPLALGATPVQVFSDGIPQIENSAVTEKPQALQHAPKVPNFDEEARRTVEYDGLPPLVPSKVPSDLVIFVNVKEVLIRSSNTPGIEKVFSSLDGDDLGVILTRNGRPVCWGAREACTSALNSVESEPTIIDLQGGSIMPALVSYGTSLGLQHISLEASTTDGSIFDPLTNNAPSILGEHALIRAVDGLQYESRDALLAYRAGVTTSVTAPSPSGFFFGLGTCFSTGASHKLEPGALIQEVTALHTSVSYNGASSVSTQIAVLRRTLLETAHGPLGAAVSEVTAGHIPLVVHVGSADVIASLISLKKEVEALYGNMIQLTISGGAEAHLLAPELAEANVGVIIAPIHPFPDTWETRRALPGPPLTRDTTITKLLEHNVTVGIGLAMPSGPPPNWNAQNLRLFAAWAALDSNDKIDKEQAIALASINVEKLLGVTVKARDIDFVATVGGDLLDPSSRVAAVISPLRKRVDLF